MTTADEPIPSVEFDSDLLPAEQRLAGWTQVTPGYDPSMPAGCSPLDFQAQCKAWLLQDIVLTVNFVTAVNIERTHRHLRYYGRDTYTFILLTEGEWGGDLDWGELHVGTGEVGIIDFTVPWKVWGTTQRNVMMTVPRAMVAELVPEAPRLHGRVLEGASGRMFAEHMLTLARHLPDMRASDVPAVKDATKALLAAAVGALKPREMAIVRPGIRAASPAAVRAYIDRHLTDPDLGIDRICREAAVTRSTLYRALEEEGGVSAYIWRRRLEAAHARVSDPSERAALAEIADRFCFSSPAHFSTAFRRRYGYTPREARGQLRQDATALFRSYREALESWLSADLTEAASTSSRLTTKSPGIP